MYMGGALFRSASGGAGMKAPGSGADVQAIPLARRTGGLLITRGRGGTGLGMVDLGCGGGVFLGARNILGAEDSLGALLGTCYGGCGISIFSVRSLERACTAEYVRTKVEPGALRMVLKRSDVAVAVGLCIRTARRTGRGRVLGLRGCLGIIWLMQG